MLLCDGRPCCALGPAEQDGLLAQVERGDASCFEPGSAAAFFTLARKLVLEGLLVESLYGGSRDNIGWRRAAAMTAA